MSPEADKRMQQWLSRWQAAGPVLQRLRDEALRRSDTALVIESLSDAFDSDVTHLR